MYVHVKPGVQKCGCTLVLWEQKLGVRKQALH